VKHYAGLVDMGCFSRKDAVELTGGTEAANSMLYSYKKKGLIESVRRDLFVTISLETKQPIPSRYAIASHIADDAYITNHSAFEYYGLVNQLYYEVYVASASQFRSFEYDGVTYRRVLPAVDKGVVKNRDGVRATDMERTVLDGINDFDKIAGLEEFMRCMELIPHLNGDKLFSYLMDYDLGFLYQKTGYVLEYFKKQLSLSDAFFNACRAKIPKSKRYFYHGLQYENHVLVHDWLLYVPEDLSAVTRKGGGYVK